MKLTPLKFLSLKVKKATGAYRFFKKILEI